MLIRILIILILPLTSICQNTIGLPNIINYNKIAYRGGLQNWKIKQDRNGIIYVANNEGLLSFDGKHWKIYPLPNKTIVRTLEIALDGKIYVGGQDEMGFFAPNKNGVLVYNSLVDKINNHDRDFADVWDIVSYKENVFFRTTSKIFRLQNESFSVLKAPSEWTYLGITNGSLYSHDRGKGLLIFQNNIWESIPSSLILNTEVTAILKMSNQNVLISTLKNGTFIKTINGITKTNESINKILQDERIFTAIELGNNWMAFATTNNGVFIIDSAGELVQHFSKIEGLQNNNVHSIYLDKQQNLWLSLDNGIDCIAFNSAIKLINPKLQDGSGYTARVFKNNLYMGTSTGLFSVPLSQTTDLSFSKGAFTQVSNTNGQVWGLSEINGALLLAHHDGAFKVNGNTATNISKQTGVWNFTPMTDIFPTNKIVAGNYNGLSFFDYSNNNFSAISNIPRFNESSRFVVLDKNNNIWVSHPYHGLYKIINDGNNNYTTKSYAEKNGLPSSLNNHVYKIKGEVVVGTEKGVYTYNYEKDVFDPSVSYKKILGEQSIRYLKEDTEGNIWFVHEKKLGVFSFSNNNSKLIYLPELNKKLLSGFEFIYPLNKNNIFISGDAGLFHVNYEKYTTYIFKLEPQITSVHIINAKDSVLFGGYYAATNEKQIQTKNQIPEINSSWKTIHFEYATPYYGQQNNLEYSYRLVGFEKNWSDWSNISEKEYTNLAPKDYTFEVKVRNNNEIVSTVTSYKFEILPPWYLSRMAFLLYFLLIGAGINFLYRRQQNKFRLQESKNDEEQKRLLYLHQLEIEKTENELVALRYEKLNTEIDFKNAELATSAMHLVQKGELLSKLKADLSQLAKGLENEKAVSEIKKMIKVLGEDDKMDDDWEHFAQHFDKVHSDFVTVLKEKHPTVTANEIKLSAYLRMNLSTKEIAQLMNISTRGIEISRYRLRKKLALTTEVSLFEYFINLGGKDLKRN